MFLNHQLQGKSTFVLRLIGWSVALAMIFLIMYKTMFQKQLEHSASCGEVAEAAMATGSPLVTVDKYAACVNRKSAAKASSTPARCKYAGVWSAARGNAIHRVTLDVNGKFIAEPGANARADAEEITGAWGIAGRALVWSYDSGAVWPPDVNPISAATDSGFTLAEVDGATTRYTLISRSMVTACL